MTFKNKRSITEGISIYSLIGDAELTTSPTKDEEDSEPAIHMDLFTSGISNEKNKYEDVTNKSKKTHPEMTKENADLLQKGREIIAAMSEEERNNLGSKSGTLHFVNLLGLQSRKSTRTITDGQGRRYIKASSPVGITLKSDDDIEVPEIDISKNIDNGIDLEKDISKNIDNGIDLEKDISYRKITAGEEFNLTYYECMFLLLRDEYAGFCEANGNDRGLYLSVKSTAFMKGDTKLPTPTLAFKRNNRIKYAGVDEHAPIKSNIVDIDEKLDGKWVIKEAYAEKFGALLRR